MAKYILGCKKYFCRPYCLDDKGSIENKNKSLTQFLPEKTNFNLISDNTTATILMGIDDRTYKIAQQNTPSQRRCLLLNPS